MLPANDEPMVKEIRTFGDQCLPVIAKCCDDGFNCFLTEFLGGSFRPGGQQFCRPGCIRIGACALFNDGFQIMQRELAHGILCSRIQPHGKSGCRHMGLGLTDGMLSEMENRCRQHARRLAVPHSFNQMIKRTDTA